MKFVKKRHKGKDNIIFSRAYSYQVSTYYLYVKVQVMRYIHLIFLSESVKDHCSASAPPWSSPYLSWPSLHQKHVYNWSLFFEKYISFPGQCSFSSFLVLLLLFSFFLPWVKRHRLHVLYTLRQQSVVPTTLRTKQMI